LVTGVGGFIARWVARELLEAGLAVRGTTRSSAAADRVGAALAASGADVSRLSFAYTDLTRDEGWAAAVAGCRFIQHIASPFPIQQPRDREALVRPAREGALRVVGAALAAGADRVVVTSSMVAMMYRPGRPSRFHVSEADWTDPEWADISAYIVSKTRAERAVWELAAARGAQERVTVINPGFVLGPPIGSDFGTSLNVIQLMLDGRYPAVPPAAFPIVDVRDLARLHVRAMGVPAAAGRRLIAAADTLSLPEIAAILRGGLGSAARRVPRLTLPAFMVRPIAVVDAALRSLVADLNAWPVAEAGYVTELTGVAFRPAREAVLAAGRALVARTA
jgi:dihydroflavonol-4-reductase